MISASPHLYQQGAAKKDVPKTIVRRALDQARTPERKGVPAILTLNHLAHLTGVDYNYLLDDCLQKVADKQALVYTRYSDDVTFSTSAEFTRKAAWHLVCEVERVFSAFGHQLHRRKVTVAPPGARKVVLGLLVDGNMLKLSREFRDRLSDHIRGIEKFGLARHAREWHFASLWGLTRHVQGLLVYAAAVDTAFAGPLQRRFSATLIAQGWPRSVKDTR